MQDLRDKLVKAGLAKKKEAREARTESRRQRKKKGGAQADAERELEQQRRFEEKQARQTEASQLRQEQLNRERAEKERESQIQDLIRAHAVVRFLGRDRPFYFLGPQRRIGGERHICRFQTSFELAAQLSAGRLAIVELRDDPARILSAPPARPTELQFALVDAETAGRLEQLDAADRILFWNRPGSEGDLPTHGAC